MKQGEHTKIMKDPEVPVKTFGLYTSSDMKATESFYVEEWYDHI